MNAPPLRSGFTGGRYLLSFSARHSVGPPENKIKSPEPTRVTLTRVLAQASDPVAVAIWGART
jgi:hypothetical protein